VTNTTTEQLIQTGFEHLGRFAFYTRDNPFVSRQASFALSSTYSEELERLLDGEIEVADWLQTDLGRRLLADIRVGSLPRDVQLLFRDGEQVVGVDSVHAFLHAQLFWWLVSILWSISVADFVDPLLGDGVKGFRFEKAFLSDPRRGGLMFADQRFARGEWKDFPEQVRKEHPGQFLTTAKLDLRAFYYSIDAGPARILNAFLAVHGKRPRRQRRVRVLTELLGVLHRRYAERCAAVAPRKADLGEEGKLPLPVGLPSSQVLANMIVSMALGEIEEEEQTVAAAAYADDLVVMSEALAELREPPAAFLARIGLISVDEPYELKGEITAGIGRLITGEDKMAISYARYVAPESEEEAAARKSFLERLGLADADWEGYDDDNADWGGRLTTVLRSAHKRERVPRKLRNELLGLLDEVRVGLAPEETAKRFDEFLGELDRRLFVALRPYWCELIVIAIAARGVAVVKNLTEGLREIIETVVLPEGTGKQGYRALKFGLRNSWYQALAQAIAVATSEEDREELRQSMPRIGLGLSPKKSRTMKGTIASAMRIRDRRLIPSSLVAVPLAEFSEWEGALIGTDAFADFLEWRRAQDPPGADPAALAERVEHSLRFINLHEACLAIHLWAGRSDEEWLEQAFRVLKAQPLIDAGLVAELRASSESALALERGEEDDGKKKRRPQIGMPSMPVDENQLKAIVTDDRAELGMIAKRSRGVLQSVVRNAANNKVDFLVLPEWSILPQLVPWLMEQASSKQMLVIGGQAPTIAGTIYWNRLWTGIPLTDSAGHRACLVLPPRQKHFLSPDEEKDISDAGFTKAPSARGEVKPFAWRGMLIASLICFEFADIDIRRRLRFKADVLTVSSLNRDWHYFDVVQESTTRDNYCMTICVNTGSFPGTRIVRPTKSEMAVIASVHGSDHPAVITKRVDMWPIVAAQLFKGTPKEVIEGYEPSDGIKLCQYKPFPPV
jgi:hypothetical protein